MRKLGIAILIIVVLLVAATLIVPHLINVNQYHDKIQAELEKRLGRQVSLGNMHLSLLPLSFQVENATIAEDQRFNTSRPFATTEKLAISVKFWPLLHKEAEVKSLELDRPHIELVRDAQGVWNFATLGQEPKPGPAHPSSSSSAKNVPQAAPATKSAPQTSAGTKPAHQPSPATTE